ncbi:MAG: trypsin-like serine protease [Gammaproteobacteria bacterium]|nr:trypsin-like serine protease [Gammaproteobacteria bacterium]
MNGRGPSHAPPARLLAVLLLLSSSVSGSDPRPPPVPGLTGTGERVIEDSRAHPWRAIGRLHGTPDTHCTATVIAPRQVLTAAHCLWDRYRGRWLPPSALRFLADFRHGGYGVQALAAAIRIGEDFDTRLRHPARDWAVLTLDRNVAAVTGTLDLAARSPAPGDALILAGYGRDRPHLLTVDRWCRVAGVWHAQSLFTHDCDATFGDSGSPLLLRTAQGYRMAGLHSASLDRAGRARGVAVMAAAVRRGLSANPVTPPLGGVEVCGHGIGAQPGPVLRQPGRAPLPPVVADRESPQSTG